MTPLELLQHFFSPRENIRGALRIWPLTIVAVVILLNCWAEARAR